MKKIAVIGAGMAGITAARTLVQAGHSVSVFEKSRAAGGRMATRDTPFGGFDHGAQYFTVRDERFMQALNEVPGTQALCKAWSASSVQVRDPLGRVIEVPKPSKDLHFVGAPGMNALVRHWAAPLADAGQLFCNTTVKTLKRHGSLWQLMAADNQVLGDFDSVVLAIPNVQAAYLLRQSGLPAAQFNNLADAEAVTVAPCWTLMLAFPLVQPGLGQMGPQWNVAQSTHHRIAWVARESSKPGRSPIERWTVQASAEWSQEHVQDDEARVEAKLLKAFAELTGIRAEPGFSQIHLWRYAKTLTPAGQAFFWDEQLNIGMCGDWLIGHRVEDAFVSGLSLALGITAPD